MHRLTGDFEKSLNVHLDYPEGKSLPQKISTTIKGEKNGELEKEKSVIITNLMIKELELIDSNFSSSFYKILLVSSALLCGCGYAVDSSLRLLYPRYANNYHAGYLPTSKFEIINDVVSVAAQIIFAKLSDYFGRITLLLASVLLYTTGAIIQSEAHNFQLYVASAVLYKTGFVGVVLLINLIMSDFSTLQWRMMFQYMSSWPYLVSPWILGSMISTVSSKEEYLRILGMWEFICPLTALPILSLLIYMKVQTAKTKNWKLLHAEKVSRAKSDSNCLPLFWKLDIFGLVLCTILLGCILVPISLAEDTTDGWNDSRIVGALFLGTIVAPIFALWELKYAKTPIFLSLLKKRQYVSIFLCFSFFNGFVYNLAYDYIFTALIVAKSEGINSGYGILSQIPNLSSILASVFVAIILAKKQEVRPSIIFGTLLWGFSMGLLYRCRDVEYLNPCVVGGLALIGLGSACVEYPCIVGLQSLFLHEDMAIATTVYLIMTDVSSSLGTVVAGAIWNKEMYRQIIRRTANTSLARLACSNPFNFLTTYPQGARERIALIDSLKQVQTFIMIVGLCFSAAMFILSFFVKTKRLISKVAHGQGSIKYAQDSHGFSINEKR